MEENHFFYTSEEFTKSKVSLSLLRCYNALFQFKQRGKWYIEVQLIIERSRTHIIFSG